MLLHRRWRVEGLIMLHVVHCDLIDLFGDSRERETRAIKDHNDCFNA